MSSVQQLSNNNSVPSIPESLLAFVPKPSDRIFNSYRLLVFDESMLVESGSLSSQSSSSSSSVQEKDSKAEASVQLLTLDDN